MCAHSALDDIQDFLCKLGMKPHMHLAEIVIFFHYVTSSSDPTLSEEIAFTARLKINLSMAEAYFVCHIGLNFQISLIYAFIGCL